MSTSTTREVTKAAGLAILAALLLLALVVGVWAFRVATSDVTGRGNAIIKKNSAVNRVAAQERFEDLYQEVITADQRIDVMAAAVELDPSTVNQTNLTGAIAYCIDTRGDYDAEARKYGSADFRAFDLPDQISPLDSNTDCKESTTR